MPSNCVYFSAPAASDIKWFQSVRDAISISARSV